MRFSLLLLPSLFIPQTVLAQVIPDNTLPNNSLVIVEEIITITGGTTAGNNLFHSFEQFSIPTGNTVFFNNAPNIENIINRVTGNNLSNIDGIISTLGEANLFLINPNGIIFGANAQLDIGGSFLATTADSLVFSDGTIFSAVQPNNPILTINIPIGLQMGTNPGSIEVEGSGNGLFIGEFFETVRDERPLGLAVPQGKTLALVGGNLTLDGGNVTATQGKIELGAAKDGVVELSENFNYDSVAEFGDINLINEASVDVSGDGAGIVNVRGENLTLNKGSAILATTEADISGGAINLNIEDTIALDGVSENEFWYTNIVAEQGLFGFENTGADININTKNLTLTNGAQINAGNFGEGTSGDINITANNINISGSGPDAGSGIYAQVNYFGNTGDINIEAENIRVLNGAAIDLTNFSSGKSGNINMTTDNLEVSGSDEFGFPAILSANSESEGNGGAININAQNILITDTAQITNTAFNAGAAGNIKINATNLEVIGGEEPGTGIFSNAESPFPSGTGGDINIEATNILMDFGAQIGSFSFGEGNAGNVNINGENLTVIGSEIAPVGTFIVASVEPEAVGNGGQLNINVNELSVQSGAQITTSTLGTGNAGKLSINADLVNLDGFNEFGKSGLFSSAFLGSGNGGAIAIEADTVNITNGATINVSNFQSQNNQPPGTGAAGEIEITANQINLTSNTDQSTITASTFANGGGNIKINTPELNLTNSSITAETKGTSPGGEITINSNAIALNEGTISTSTFAAGEGGTVTINSENLTAINNSQISSQVSGGSGEGGTIVVNATIANISERSALTTSTDSNGKAGGIAVTANQLNLSDGAGIGSESSNRGAGGTISLNIQQLDLNQAQITTSSTGKGRAGDINLQVGSLLGNKAQIVAESALSNGGEIKIKSDRIELKNNSLVSTSVFTGDGGGGDLTITNSDLILLSQNSDLRANAEFGAGGNITITTNFLFASPSSDIDASSKFGVDGTVEIDRGINQEISTDKLPESYQPNKVVSSSCPISQDNSLAVTGKGGIARVSNPLSALEEIIGIPVATNQKIKLNPTPETPDIVEAQNIVINSEGNIELIPGNNSPSNSWYQITSCAK